MLQDVLTKHKIPHTAFKYAENTGQMAPIREQAGTFADSIKLWNEAGNRHFVSVIASAAKQSTPPVALHDGLPRRFAPRNDARAAVHSIEPL